MRARGRENINTYVHRVRIVMMRMSVRMTMEAWIRMGTEMQQGGGRGCRWGW